MATRYTAHIRINRTVTADPPQPGRERMVVNTEEKRNIQQLDMSVSATDLDTLKEKVAGHLNLVDEDDIHEPAKSHR